MTHGLWGHALFLASKMDERSYSRVMLRFANGLDVNDPLQTLYQLMSGRLPIAVKVNIFRYYLHDFHECLHEFRIVFRYYMTFMNLVQVQNCFQLHGCFHELRIVLGIT